MMLFSPVSGRGLAVALAALTLSGCSLLKKDEFACPAAAGASCMSVEEAYRRSLGGGNTQTRRPVAEGAAATTLPSYRTDVRPTPESGSPIRSQPRILRVWIAPWEDKEGDLHDQSYLWVTVDTGHWLLDHTKRQVHQAFRPVLPPRDFKESAEPTPAPGVPALPTLPVQPGTGLPSMSVPGMDVHLSIPAAGAGAVLGGGADAR